MHLRHKHTIEPSDVIGKVTEAAQRSELPEQAAKAAKRVATNVADKSSEVGSHASDLMSEAARIATEEGHAMMQQRRRNRAAKKPRRHRLRKAVALTSAGAIAAYFFDPDNGTKRRAAAMRRTSQSAQTVGDGLEKAAHAAHQTADATSP